jgi:hypothetical protein
LNIRAYFIAGVGGATAVNSNFRTSGSGGAGLDPAGSAANDALPAQTLSTHIMVKARRFIGSTFREEFRV